MQLEYKVPCVILIIVHLSNLPSLPQSLELRFSVALSTDCWVRHLSDSL